MASSDLFPNQVRPHLVSNPGKYFKEYVNSLAMGYGVLHRYYN